jgi:hypothetical protein
MMERNLNCIAPRMSNRFRVAADSDEHCQK